MFPDNISQNIDILVVINVWKNNFGFHSNRKTQGQKHRVNNLYFKYQVCQMKLRHLNTFLQFRLLFHEPHCNSGKKKKPDTAYFYHNLVLLLKKYIKSMTILKSFEKSSIWVVERNSNLKTLEVMLIWKKSIKLKSARYDVFF